MADFEYYYAKGNDIRAMCDCASNTVGDTAATLKAVDPTPKAEPNGWTKWTSDDSRRIGIDHATLEAAWKTLKERSLICNQNNIAPGCTFTGYNNWFMDQRDRVEAIVQKREPKLLRWNLTTTAADNLKQWGITVTSPWPLTGRNQRQEPLPTYDFQPTVQAVRLMKNSEQLLNIPLATAAFVDIANRYNGEIEILVTHTNDLVSLYRIQNGVITQRYEHVKAETLR